MSRKVIIDTNVLVSALLSSHEDSATVRLLMMLLDGRIIPVITDGIFSEYGEVLRRKKFRFPEESVSVLLDEIRKKSRMIKPALSDVEMPDENDRPFLDALLTEDETILIIGNLKHFPRHERIMTARDFLALYDLQK